MKKLMIFVGVMVAFVIGIALAGGGTENTQTHQGGGPATGEPKTAKVGVPVRDGKFEFTVTKVDIGVKQLGDEFLNTKAQGEFALVHVRVKNIGDEAQLLNDFDQKAYDANGKRYEADSEAGIYANEQNSVWLEEINPGNVVEGVLVYDVPAGTKITKLELHDSSYSGGVNVDLS